MHVHEVEGRRRENVDESFMQLLLLERLVRVDRVDLLVERVRWSGRGRMMS